MVVDPFSAAIGSLQVAGQCVQATIAIGRYINQVLTVDQRIRAFYEDIAKLQTTYEALEQCRSSPQMITAAKAADNFTEHLWSHLATTLRDCESTLVAINQVLGRIDRPVGFSAPFRRVLEPPVKQLMEQLHGGELARHHDKIKMFNTSLALPMQMINITLQLNQKDLSEEHQRRLETRLTLMQTTIESLYVNIADLRRSKPLRSSSTVGSSTLIESTDHEKAVCEHMEVFARRAKVFLSNASSAVSVRSGASTVNPDNIWPVVGTSEAGMPLTHRERKRIDAWLPARHEEVAASPTVSEATPSPSTECGDDEDSDEEDFDLDLVQTYFENGQVDLGQDDFAAAEENFLEALNLLEHNDFGERLAFQAADVVLLLTHCYSEQSKYDQAIELLLPLIGDGFEQDATMVNGTPSQRPKKRPDRGRILAAQHSLGNVYLKKKDYEHAEKHAILAFKGRSKLFGREHEKTIESVQLVVDVYSAKEERAKARAYSKYLMPVNKSSTRSPDLVRRPSANNNFGTSPRSANLGEVVTIERSETAPSLTIPSPYMLNPTTSRKVSNDLHTAESLTTSTTRSPATLSIFDDASTVSSVTKASSVQRSASSTPKHYLKPRFDAVKRAAHSSRDKACDETKHILKGYDPEPARILTQRWPEIRNNIKKKGAEKGLAATGQGYAPIHFFCELNLEAVTEVGLLIEEGVDLMASRYRAGWKTEPMTPLQLAIERNHQTIAVMMIDALQAASVPVSRVMGLQDPAGLSPLLAACRSNQIETVGRLLEFSAGIVSTSTTGFPPSWVGNSLLHDAASRCDVDMVNLLLSLKTQLMLSRKDIGSLEQQDQYGRSALMYAVMSKNIADQPKRDRKVKNRYACVEFILQSANAMGIVQDLVNIRDGQNMDVSAYAKAENDGKLVDLLRQYSGLGKGRALP